MISNYLLIAWRNIRRNKAYSVINIAGLALGLTCSLLIMLWVADEKRTDGFHRNGDRLFQIFETSAGGNALEGSYYTQGLLAEELKRQIPGIGYASGYAPDLPVTFETAKGIYRMSGAYAGEDFFRMFSYPLLEGNAGSLLQSRENIVISRDMAGVFFGTPEQAIGKSIRFENKEDLTVTGVFENVPPHSSQQFSYLRSWEAFKSANAWVSNWNSTSPYTFIQLQPQADAGKVQAALKDFIHHYIPKRPEQTITLGMQAYPEKYLYATFRNGIPSGGRIEYVRLFSIVAIFILLIACINFMNLATARSAKRAKEVGVRKVLGAMRGTLTWQFIGEALLLTFAAMLISLLMLGLLLPAFNTLTGKQLAVPFYEPLFWIAVPAVLLITGFMAGSYPAVYLSSLQPVRVLKGSLAFSKGNQLFRKGLVVFQFSLSVILIVGMIVTSLQMKYLHTRNTGYNRDNLVYLPVDGTLKDKYELFKSAALKLPGVTAVSKMRHTPTFIEHQTGDIDWPGRNRSEMNAFTDAIVGYDFVQTLGLQLKSGRDFSPHFASDSVNVIINETAARKIGYNDPVGKPLQWGRRNGVIIGVLKDFHFTSMHRQIEPLVMRLDDSYTWGTVMVRIAPGKTQTALAGLEKLHTSVNPKFPFVYQFSDQEYLKLYKSEQVMHQLANYFAFLAIFISCLGLFGMATFIAEQRTKEIGVRKVLGASVPQVYLLLSAGLLRPVAVAFLFAAPIAWYIMQHWLKGFAYHISMNAFILLAAGIITTLIALMTVSFHSIRAALVNPVKSLKSE